MHHIVVVIMLLVCSCSLLLSSMVRLSTLLETGLRLYPLPMSLCLMIVFWDVVGASTSDRVGGDVSTIICVPVVSVVCFCLLFL